MRLIIPYRPKLNSTELRYAIRSMCMYFTDLTGITLVGTPPDWYKGDHINVPDVKGRKEFSIYNKLRIAGNGETVLFANDDHFALKPFGADLPNYYMNTCGEYAGKSRVYRDMYMNCPSEWLNFDVHTPMVIDTSKLPEWTIDRPLKSLYGNMNKLQGTYYPDVKISGSPTYEECCDAIRYSDFFSTHDNTHHEGVLQLLQTLYPVASQYERD